MTISKSVNGSCATIAIEGWLDVETTAKFAEFMQNLDTYPKLVLDFNRLEYISSSGVREIVAAYRRQKNTDGEFSIINVNTEVMEIFDMTGLNTKMTISGQ